MPRTGLGLIGRALRRQGPRLALGYPLITLWQMCETLVPVVIGIVIDRGVATGDTHDFVWSLLLLAVLFGVLSNAYRFGSRYVFGAWQDEGHRLRTEIAGHVLDPRGAKTGMLPGETLSLATSDTDLTAGALRQLAFATASLVSVVVVAVYVLQVDLGLGLLILLGVPAVVVVIQSVTPLVARRTTRQQESAATASGLAGDLVQGLRPLKGIGGEDVALGRYRAASRRSRDDTIAVARSWGYLTGMTTGLSGVLLAAVTLIAGSRAIDGDISVGQLIALVGLTQFLAEPITAIGELSAQFAASRASANRIVAFLVTPRILADGSAVPADEHPQVRLDGVAAGPLHEVSFETRPYELLAMVVDDPAASDALVGLLNGDRNADRGTVRLGGTPLADLSIESRRRHLLVSVHHAAVFEGTLRSAVDPDGRLSPGALATVLTASAADDVVALHPDGLDGAVRGGGSSLSGGQRQRLALARALATGSPLLVLQDPTSALDSVTEQSVARGLRSVRSGVGTTIVITSSPALLQQADRVLVVRDGRLAAAGTHAELSADPDYRAAVLR